MHDLLATLALLTSCVAGAFFSPALLSLHWQDAQGYYNPTLGGGSMLDNAGYGLGEPLNVIISGLSSPGVLTDKGIINYARAIGFSTECFGIHLGTPQTANLGDGNGWVNQSIELRQDYGNAGAGTCLESAIGGNHFRVWHQNGQNAKSGALFLAVSKEEPATDKHDIVPDGYNIGRDLLAANAVGKTWHWGVTYYTVAQNLTGLLAPGSQGVNHGIAQDGITTLLTTSWFNYQEFWVQLTSSQGKKFGRR